MWTKPRPGFYKLNLDAAFHDDGTGAVGVVLRNCSGEAIAGTAGPIYHVMDATSAEALAMLKGMELLERLGCSGVVVESDCLQLINACTGDTELFDPFSATLAEIFAKAQAIDGISFQHCKRDANLVAHNLEKHSYESKSVIFWDDDPPSFLLPYVIHDVTLLASK